MAGFLEKYTERKNKPIELLHKEKTAVPSNFSKSIPLSPKSSKAQRKAKEMESKKNGFQRRSRLKKTTAGVRKRENFLGKISEDYNNFGFFL
jgi:hypothetical protein